MSEHDVLARELAYHERLYSGFAQQHFAKPAVRALRAHMVRRVLQITGADRSSRVLSLGCGIGDTELLLAPYVGEIVGVDLSPAAVRQATEDARALGIRNARFVEGSLFDVRGSFDATIAIFFLHHLPHAALNRAPSALRSLLRPRGVFYSLDPNRYRLSGAVGSLLIPHVMRKYQTEDEHELDPAATAALFRSRGFAALTEIYDFASSPLAGLFPKWRSGYQAARAFDELLIRLPIIRRLGSNFEVIAHRLTDHADV